MTAILELRFHVPQGARLAVVKAMALRAHRSTRVARHFDTPDRRLARAGLGLRLCGDDGRWAQTLSVRQPGGWRETDHDVHLASDGAPVAVELALHSGTPEGDAARRALGKHGASRLVERCCARLERTVRRVRSGQILLTLILEVGELQAQDRRVPVFELAFQSSDDSVDALLAAARQWTRRHGLWLEPRSPGQRGDGLAQGVAAGEEGAEPARPMPPALELGLDPGQGLQRMLRASLVPLLSNVAAVADDTGNFEHLHQVRVGLRRLRSILKVFGHADPQRSAAVQEGLSQVFDRLGSARDRDVFQLIWQPRLAAVGAPAVSCAEPADVERPGEVLREASTTLLWLDLIGFASANAARDPGQSHGAAASLAAFVALSLRRLQRQVRRDAARWAVLDDEARHRLRRRMKRLRYALEATEPLWPQRRLRRWLSLLRDVQEALGAYCDLLASKELLVARARHDPGAWFALGWLTAQQPALLATAGVMLRQWLEVPRPGRLPRSKSGRHGPDTESSAP